MAQPLLARLRAKLGAVRIDALAPPWVAPVLGRMPEIDDVLETPFVHGPLQLRERWRLGRDLKVRDYQQAIVLPNAWKAALVPFFADIPIRSGYVGESRYGLLNLLYRRQQDRDEPMAKQYARLAERPGIEPELPLPEVRLEADPGAIRSTTARLGLPARYAVFCPGAEYGPAKRWPYFAELAGLLELPVVLLGAKGDAPACEGIAGTNLCGRTTLEEAIDVIAGAAFVVTNDSGLMHVAAALGRPQVAVFGSSSPKHTPPLSTRARVLWLGIECSPCYARECPLGHFRCMRDITATQVAAEAARLEVLPSTGTA
jgi:heptosyltransferase-2